MLPFVNPAVGQAGINPLYIASGRSADSLQTLGYNEGQQASRDNYTWGIQGELSYELADNLSVNDLGSYRKFIRDESFSLFNGSVFNPNLGILANLVFPGTFEGDYRQNSQELRFAYSGDRLKVQLGGYYFREESAIALLIFGAQGAAGTRGSIFGFPQNPTISKSVAGFGQATYSVTDTLRITAGIRHTKDDKSRIGTQIFHATLTDPLDFTTGVQPGTTNPNNRRDSANNASVSYGRTTWRAGLEYDFNDQTLVCAPDIRRNIHDGVRSPLHRRTPRPAGQCRSIPN